MPELRTDWLTDRAVIVAENRALRPNEFAEEAASPSGMPWDAAIALAEAGLPELAGVPRCPFCVGNEEKTPPALYEKLDEHGRWRVRVVPNMFPAVTVPAGGELTSDSSDIAESTRPALGAHEVIIESARHIEHTSALSAAELRDVLEAYAERLRYWRATKNFAYGLVFKNQGPRAGASMAHLHSQFIAFPTVPTRVAAEAQRALDLFHRERSCPYCGLIERERSFGKRIVTDRDGYIAFCPFASLQPHEVWLLPTGHEGLFEDVSTDALDRLATVLHELIGCLELLLPAAAYNLLLRTAPWAAGNDGSCHWRIELLPRVTSIAGFEIATGLHINPLAPERAAAQLRPV